MMAKRQAKRVRRELTPEERRRWERAVAETEADRGEIIKQGRAVVAARRWRGRCSVSSRRSGNAAA